MVTYKIPKTCKQRKREGGRREMCVHYNYKLYEICPFKKNRNVI